MDKNDSIFLWKGPWAPSLLLPRYARIPGQHFRQMSGLLFERLPRCRGCCCVAKYLPFCTQFRDLYNFPPSPYFSLWNYFLFGPIQFLSSHHISTSSLFQVRYHQLLALHQLVHLQSVADTWDCVWYSKYVQAGGREEGKADIYVLNRMLQAQEWPHSLQLQGPTPPQEHEKTKTKTKKTSKNCQNQIRWNSRK